MECNASVRAEQLVSLRYVTLLVVAVKQCCDDDVKMNKENYEITGAKVLQPATGIKEQRSGYMCAFSPHSLLQSVILLL